MFDNNYKKNYYFYYLFFLSVFFLYALLPYILSLNDYFLEILLKSYPVRTHATIRNKIHTIISDVNFHYLTLLNTFLFIIFLIISLKFLVKKKITYKNQFSINKKHVILIAQFIAFFCFLLLLRDLFDFFSYYKKTLNLSEMDNPYLDREKFYRYFHNKKQTHYIVGSIFSIFCLKNNKIIIPIMFLTLLCLIEIASLSRFYIFIVFTCILVISKKKFIPYLLFIIFLIISYRFFLLGSASIKNFSTNLFFEPVSLISNEIVKLLNGRIEWSQISFFKDLIIKNLNSNFLFFDYSKTYYIFDDKHVFHFRSFAQYGLLDILAYPIQIFFLLSLIYFLRKVLDKFYDFKDLYLITNVFCMFMIVRGSAIYGLSFFVKIQIIFLVLSILAYYFNKFNILKI